MVSALHLRLPDRRRRRLRVVTALALTAALTGCASEPGPGSPRGEPAATARQSGSAAGPAVIDAAADFEALEARFDARLGVFALDTGSGAVVEHRADERFAYASTIKALAAAVLLAQTTPADLDEVVRYGAADLVDFSPVTGPNGTAGMRLGELARASVTRSDNTAANLVLDRIGGPQGLEDALRAVGDRVTAPERAEPELNEAVPGDVRDTSTPRALATSLQAYALGGALDEQDRGVLNGWLRDNTTGDGLIRAGVPAGWEVGDKTGAGGYGTRNDMAVVRPPGKAPIVLAVLSSRADPDADHDDALIAEATRVAVRALSTAPGPG